MRIKPKVLIILGTRPEAIKLAPVIRALRNTPLLRLEVCATAQHRALLDDALAAFAIRPDHDLDIMRRTQSPDDVLRRALKKLRPLLEKCDPDLVLVQGDTTTALAGASAAFLRRIPVAHVEAGLRSFDLDRPFPEEINRVLIDRLSSLWFPPTARAAHNLRAEGVRGDGVWLTGNTAIDAVKEISRCRRPSRCAALRALPRRRLILATLHRRESFGAPMEGVFQALLDIANRNADAAVAFTVHPNPEVRRRARRLLRHPRIILCPPVEYRDFVRLMKMSHFIITDSGGIQEEAPTLRKPVLVARDVTDRPELIRAGGGRLVGTEPGRIVRQAERLLRDRAHYRRMARSPNPFGDGRAAPRIRAAILHFLGVGRKPRPLRPAP
ncbi:MAG: UDP-N-acetylglucosamine 2-epimerase (non-hydrolyzing) [Elusimicrobiota bacterium]